MGGLILLLPAVVLASAVALASDHEEARDLRQRADILPLARVLERIPSNARLLEVELEHEHGALVYEIEYLTEDGVVREVYLDAVSGDIVKEHRHD